MNKRRKRTIHFGVLNRRRLKKQGKTAAGKTSLRQIDNNPSKHAG